MRLRLCWCSRSYWSWGNRSRNRRSCRASSSRVCLITCWLCSSVACWHRRSGLPTSGGSRVTNSSGRSCWRHWQWCSPRRWWRCRWCWQPYLYRYWRHYFYLVRHRCDRWNQDHRRCRYCSSGRHRKYFHKSYWHRWGHQLWNWCD